MDFVYAFIVVIVIILIWIIAGYTRLQRGKIKCDEAESGIDAALTERFDVMMKIVETVEGYEVHEKLEKVIELRNPVHRNDAGIQEKQKIVAQMDQAMRAFNAAMEQYPNLKASESYKELQVSINEAGEHLQAARRVYNANVSAFNQKVQLFPYNNIAKMFRFKAREFFESEEFKRKDIEIKF